MRSNQSYSKYQKTELKWLGDVPIHWKIARNFNLFSERNEKNFPDLELLSVTIGKGLIKQKELLEKKDTSNEDKTNYKRVLRNDIVYNKMRMWQGAVGVSNYEGIVSPAYIVLIPKKGINPRYYHYLFRTKNYNLECYRHGYGIADDQHSLRFYQFKDVKSPVPLLKEQKKIAEFLDKKTVKIDQLIQKNKKIIKLLEEKRQAIITQAVTKGLNPDAAMKDSGVVYLGKVPKRWSVKRLKFVCMINPNKSSYMGPTNISVTFLPMEKVNENGTFDKSEIKDFDEVADGFTYFENGDILVAKITPCFENGKGAHVYNLENSIGFGSTEFHVLRPCKEIRSGYLYFITVSGLFRKLGKASMFGAAGQKRVPAGFISNFKVGIPTRETQKEIAQYLKSKLNLLNKIISGIILQNNELEEYCQTLISNMVTGKVKV